jgi:uncharacterized protein (DUF1330 family)
MKTNRKLFLAVLMGIAIGVAGAAAIRAQQVKTAPAYLIGEVEITDAATMQKYSEKVPATLTPFNGHFIARAGMTVPLEGDAPKRIVIIAFDSLEHAKAWYDSPAYSAIKPIRQSAAQSRLYLAEGVAPQ